MPKTAEPANETAWHAPDSPNRWLFVRDDRAAKSRGDDHWYVMIGHTAHRGPFTMQDPFGPPTAWAKIADWGQLVQVDAAEHLALVRRVVR